MTRFTTVIDPNDAGLPPVIDGSRASYRGRVSNVFASDVDFTAGEFMPDGSGDVIRFSGELVIGINDRAEIHGEWQNMARFGLQLIVDDFEMI